MIQSRLEADHAELDQLLDSVIQLFGSSVAVAYQQLDLFWARLAIHIRAEHLHLFPKIEELTKSSSEFGDLLADLRHDHDFFMNELARAIKQLRDRSDEAETYDAVSDILQRVRDRLAIHNKIEEERIYSLAPRRYLNQTASRN
jgi:iron-sulfur cluster repair protein YtfE (RIC family)